jgi:hypothetical protein
MTAQQTSPDLDTSRTPAAEVTVPTGSTESRTIETADRSGSRRSSATTTALTAVGALITAGALAAGTVLVIGAIGSDESGAAGSDQVVQARAGGPDALAAPPILISRAGGPDLFEARPVVARAGGSDALAPRPVQDARAGGPDALEAR